MDIGKQVSSSWIDGANRMIGAAASDKSILHLHYKEVVSAPIEAVETLYRHCGLTLNDDGRARMQAWLDRSPQNGNSQSRYSLTEFGMDEGSPAGAVRGLHGCVRRRPRMGPGASGPAAGGMTFGRVIAFLLGAAILIALTMYAGAGAVVHALATLRFAGLARSRFCICRSSRCWAGPGGRSAMTFPGATRRKFAWARLVRDAAAEVLPFSQIGGFVLGVRALHLGGVRAIRGALSMSVDLVMELWAKLPYFLAGLIALFAVAPNSHLVRALPVALCLTALVVAIPFFFRARLRQALEVSALAIARRWPSLDSRDEVNAFFDRIFAEKQRLARRLRHPSGRAGSSVRRKPG